jgi:DNA-binding CsgD family transcriptional regulator
MNVNEAPPRHGDAEPSGVGLETGTILTSKELKVLELLSYGYENRDVASHFRTSGQAVKNMLRTINLKLGADNRTHAVAVCFRNGWLPARDSSNLSASSMPRKRTTQPRRKLSCTRRRHQDGTVDSVCAECSLVIARAWHANDLIMADRNHVCQPTERRRKVRFIMESSRQS